MMLMFSMHIPRWIIFLIDIAICLFSFLLAHLLRFNFSIPPAEIEPWALTIPFVLFVRAASFYFGKTYSGIIRYTSAKDAERIFYVISIGSLFFAVVNILTYNFITQTFVIPYSVIIIDYITTIFIMTASRMLVKSVYLEYNNPTRYKSSVIIFGAGEAGIITKRTLDRDAGTKYKVTAFIDDDKKKAGKKLEGVQIHYKDELDALLQNNEIAHLIIALQNINPSRKQEIIETCLRHNVRVLNLPPVQQWINGELSFKQIKRIRIEDLLQRDAIRLDEKNISRKHTGKTILITGAAGSIGSELVRQVLKFNPEKVILLDQAESAMYDLELELTEARKIRNIELIIADITDNKRLKSVFSEFRPDLVYHAAAYKHVPVMESNPYEAVNVNVLGTINIADLAAEHGVKEFVFISTDKAVNPTNIMGCSKRIAEIYCQAFSKHNGCTKFITTRFGNVLGSNGSVILRFKKQIEQGGPVTITHPDVERFFMTIPEACQLVLEAGTIGNGGEIFIFDMGEPVKIDDLAKKMIKLSRLTVDKDIQIVYTGLRPGEKLFEELLNSEENTISTHHPLIMKAKVREYRFEDAAKDIRELLLLLQTHDNNRLVAKMKEIVPEYMSRNSEFEILDHDKLR